MAVESPPGHAGLGDVSRARHSGPPEGRLPGQLSVVSYLMIALPSGTALPPVASEAAPKKTYAPTAAKTRTT
jgi:hypothetical protein